uniref:Uncharacterized protein n=1 Tax=Romanomermis culicivorax TaxID=13658 RepID=A0A915IPI6_ROMCU
MTNDRGAKDEIFPPIIVYVAVEVTTDLHSAPGAKWTMSMGRIDSKQQYGGFPIQQRSSSIENPDYISLLKWDQGIDWPGCDQNGQRKKSKCCEWGQHSSQLALEI